MAVDVGETNRAHTIVVSCIVLPVITFCFILLRIWSRVFVVHSLGWDDFTATITWLFCIAYSILLGLSTDTRLVPADPEDAIYVKWINDADMVYLVSVFGYKISILILYLRLFAVNKKFRYFTWATMFFVGSYLGANLLTQIFGCVPREKYWNPDTPGHCINYTKAGLAYGSMNIGSDLIIFILPLPIVWQLRLSRREKVGVSVIFLSGAITCIVAVVRYAAIVRENAANAQYFVWSIMEINIGVMCSCMPALRPFFARVMPRIDFGSLSRKMKRSHYRQQDSEELDESTMFELGQNKNRSTEQTESAIPERVQTDEILPDERGARNIVAF